MSKHFVEEINKNGKTKKILISVIILCVVVAGGIYIVSKLDNKLNTAENEVYNNLNNLFLTLKRGKKNKANEYIDYNALISSLDEMILDKESNEMSKLEKLLFCDMKWEISDIAVSEDTATATVKMTNKNFKDIFIEWMRELVNEKSYGNEITNEMALEYLEEILKKDSYAIKTVIKDVELIKTDNKWKINVNENLRNLIFPGIDSVEAGLKENIT